MGSGKNSTGVCDIERGELGSIELVSARNRDTYIAGRVGRRGHLGLAEEVLELSFCAEELGENAPTRDSRWSGAVQRRRRMAPGRFREFKLDMVLEMLRIRRLLVSKKTLSPEESRIES
jgi:hypothetical protein